MKETRDGKTLYIDLGPGEKIDGPRGFHGPVVIRSAEGAVAIFDGPVELQGPITINGCFFDGRAVIPAGVTVTFAPTESK